MGKEMTERSTEKKIIIKKPVGDVGHGKGRKFEEIEENSTERPTGLALNCRRRLLIDDCFIVREGISWKKTGVIISALSLGLG